MFQFCVFFVFMGLGGVDGGRVPSGDVVVGR